MGLTKYKSKRHFKDTPEPAGGKSRGGSLRFVIQKHAATRLHYDFRLEMDGVLKSWAVPKGPSLSTKDKRLAMMVEDHPYDYKDFEGTIPAGNYGAGTVMVWDEGTYHALETSDPKESQKLLKAGLQKGEIKFFLEGKKLVGGFALIKLKSGFKGNENSWLLIKERDEYVVDTDVTKLDTSAKTDRTLEEIASDVESKEWTSSKAASKTSNVKSKTYEIVKEVQEYIDQAPKFAMPRDISPMLSTLMEEPFDREGWIFEIKWDGFRAISEIEKGKVKMYSRNQQPFNQLFSPIVKTLEGFNFRAVFDGEVLVLDKAGRSSFQLLQNYQNTGSGNLTYYVFDLLYYEGRDLRSLPLWQRKKILKTILPKAKNIKFSDHIEDEGVAFFHAAQKQNLEGIMGKNSQSDYRVGRRTSDWVKIKTHMRQEAVIVGFTEPRGSRTKFGALILGVYEGKDLKYIGHTGGGFDEKTLKVVHDKLKPLIIDKPAFKDIPKTNAPATWVKPQLVCEVSFTEWTSDGSMRQPIFLGLREDKKASQVVKEEPKDMPNKFSKEKPASGDESKVKISGKELVLTHLEKIYWPKEKYTKGDLIEYYRKISKVMLPYLKDRPENLNRHPNGITGESFYQKNMDHLPPKWAKTQKVHSDSNDKNINYLICQDEATLIYMANLGCIEINPWNSRIKDLEKPDYAIIDLDPEDIGFDKVVESAQAVHEVLEKYGIPSYPKTSGATGLHIYIPLGAKYDHDLSRQFVQLIVTMVNAKLPKITSLERSPKKRQKRVYLDYLQNRKGQTLAAPYSVRPKSGATVSTPLEWKEVNSKLDPKDFTIKNIFKRLDKKGDLFKPVLGKGIDLSKLINKLTS